MAYKPLQAIIICEVFRNKKRYNFSKTLILSDKQMDLKASTKIVNNLLGNLKLKKNFSYDYY